MSYITEHYTSYIAEHYMSYIAEHYMTYIVLFCWVEQLIQQ